ncbi:hypothetical protein [Gudongella sp. DL1XJH-153]|uniref:hypothetical protein n=1 Tax=Gudongella sp. DL1XJH-153 TaxID=3409804 RepID=UPI003BB67274
MTNKNITRKVFILLILSIALFTVACTQSESDVDKIGAYTTVIDKLHEEDTALNSNIEYIAIDTSLIINLDDEEKAELLKELEDYGFTVLDMTMEELKEEGYVEDLYFEEGILFEIIDEPIEGNSITMDISKWRSGLGAIGYDGMVVKYENEKWEIDKQGDAWIS